MSKQRPTSERIANELAGASAFFRPSPKAEPEPGDAPTPVTTPAPPPATPDPAVKSDVVTSRRHDVIASSSPATPPAFDINQETASRDSLRLSMDETKALDTLRQTLKWDYDLTVSKNDICRAALHALLEEVAAKGEKSSILTRLRQKRSSR